jgi:hypothetical protein
MLVNLASEIAYVHQIFVFLLERNKSVGHQTTVNKNNILELLSIYYFINKIEFNYESCNENKDCLSNRCIKEAGKKLCKGIFD